MDSKPGDLQRQDIMGRLSQDHSVGLAGNASARSKMLHSLLPKAQIKGEMYNYTRHTCIRYTTNDTLLDITIWEQGSSTLHHPAYMRHRFTGHVKEDAIPVLPVTYRLLKCLFLFLCGRRCRGQPRDPSSADITTGQKGCCACLQQQQGLLSIHIRVWQMKPENGKGTSGCFSLFQKRRGGGKKREGSFIC